MLRRVHLLRWPLALPMLAVVCVLAACSRKPEPEITRTVSVSAERLAQIRMNPHIKGSLRGSAPAARMGGIEDDPWPPGIMFFSEMEPYLGDLGFEPGKMIMAIDGKTAHDIFIPRWKKRGGIRPGGFSRDHYKDLIEYLFVENAWRKLVIMVYTDVPGSYEVLKDGGYKPKVEHWLIRFD